MTKSSKQQYRIKEMFYSLQGEGARAGRAAVFCRFSKCNLWNGREDSRADAVCNFCDTDILGTDGQNGGEFANAQALATKIQSLWDSNQVLASSSSSRKSIAKPYVIFTGGEPLLQLDPKLIELMHQLGFEIAIESNGTLPLPEGIDWVCLSPKGKSSIVFDRCDELKLVYPQSDALPETYQDFPADHYFLSPMASPAVRFGEDPDKINNTRLALDYCLSHPQWRLTLQMHKLLGID
ncbi:MULTISPECIES: 7-carboxy-7-deazaguanine synthase [unclassified Oleiphilus]|uniref:7-carboxy-7-deazaguanine synthase n=2 Tax=Oleiphilus TaxID=141450 RepID=UPI000A5C8742|nr:MULTISPECIES: 7-carboxy-7-deazaguanine synthase [unclassified Oleiphilus]